MKKFFAILILILSLLSAVFLGISATHSNSSGDIIKNNISSLLKDTDDNSEDEESDDDLISSLVSGLTNTVVDAVGDQLDDMEGISQLLTMYKVSFILPCILSILAGILVILPLKHMKYLVSSILSLLGCAFLIGIDLVYIPWRLESFIPDIVSSYISVKFGDIVKIIINSSGTTVVIGVVLMVVSVVLGLITFAVPHD